MTRQPLLFGPRYRPFIRAAYDPGVPVTRPRAGRMRLAPAPEQWLKGRSRRPFNSYQLNLVHAGEVWIEWPGGHRQHYVGGNAWITPPGTILAQPARTGQCLKTSFVHFSVDQNPAWGDGDYDRDRTYYGIIYSRNPALRQPPPTATWGLELPPILPTAAARLIERRLNELIKQWLARDAFTSYLAQQQFANLIAEVVTTLRREAQIYHANSLEERLARAEDHAYLTLEEGCDVNQMARIAGFDRSYFSVVFKRERGWEPKAFLQRLRLERARELLADRGNSIIDVAQACGFNDDKALAKFLRRAVGMSPSRWRAAGLAMPGDGSA